ncbi:hypothetical protein DMENIID0001_115220 [Sergentomyia squamirostris]
MTKSTTTATILVLLFLCSTVLCADSDSTTVSSNQPLLDDDSSNSLGPEPEVIDVKNLPPFPMLRNSLLDSENEVESSNGYHYDKPEIPFENTNLNPIEVGGYNYPRPQNPLTLPERPENNIQDQTGARQNQPISGISDLPDDAVRILDDEVSSVDDDKEITPDISDDDQ